MTDPKATPPPTPKPSGVDPGSRADRLGSWKAIASYLRRSVRTVRRWEEKEALPVHRHRHEKGSTVFAFRSEIDAWMERRRVKHERPETRIAVTQAAETRTAAIDRSEAQRPETRSPAPAASGRVVRARGWIPAAALAAAALALIGAWASWPPVSPSEPTAATALWVLVADVQSTGPQAAWGARLQEEVEAAIINSSDLALVPEGRRRAILRLMRQEPGIPVTEAVAREIGARDGEISAVVVSAVSARGATPHFDVRLVEPSRGVSVRTLTAEVDAGDPARSARMLATRVHDLIAESPSLRPPAQRLPEVTTASLDALRVYALGERQLRQGQPAAAAALLGQALREDPSFFAAATLRAKALALVSVSSQLPPEETPGVTLRISPVERYLAEGIRRQLSHQPSQATAAYRALASLDPGSYWAARGLLEACRELDVTDDCTPELIRLADLSPDDAGAAYEASWSLVRSGSEQAATYADRAARLMAPNLEAVDVLRDTMLQLFAAQRDWLDRDPAAAARRLETLAREIDPATAELPDPILRDLGLINLTLGRGEEAERWFQGLHDPLTRYELRALTLLGGDGSGLRSHLVREVDYREPLTAALLAMAGLGDRADRLVDRLEPTWSVGEVEVARGILAFFDNRPDDSIERLGKGLRLLGSESSGLYFMGTDLLAMAYARRDDLTTAVAVLEPTAGRRSRAAAAGTGMFWIKCQSHLAGFYRQAGRAGDAAEVENEILGLLGSAGRGHALARELRERADASRTG